MTEGSFVAYYRVSTKSQGRSGLGIDAQKDTVRNYLKSGGDSWKLKDSFTEIESGRNSDRPELMKALAACRRFRAKLLVSKLDRISRDARFLMNLKAEGVPFVIAELPQANELTIDLLAVLAEHERRLISERTKAALAIVKRRGVKKMGGHPERISRAEARRGAALSAAIRQKKADDFALAFEPELRELRASGVTSLRAIAAALNAKDAPPPRGGQWNVGQVARLIARIDALGQEP